MVDNFSNFYTNLPDPAEHAYAISANNTANVAYTTRSIYVGSGGQVDVALAGDSANTVVSFTAVPTGSVLALRVRKVFESTTANNIIGLY